MSRHEGLGSLLGSSVAALALLLVCPYKLSAVGPEPSDAAIHRQLEEILARPEFSPNQGSNPLHRLLELFSGLSEWLGGLRGTNPFLFWLLLIGCITLLVLIVGHIAWTVRRVFFVSTESRDAEGTAEQRERWSQAYWQEAQRRAAQRDFTEAIRFLFLSLVCRFDESGRVLFQRAYTNREYLSLFADRPQIRSELAVFVDTLDEYWYGQRSTGQHQYENCLALYESLK